MPAWQRRAAHASHFLLYVLFFATPITGWLFTSAAGLQVVYFGVLPIPDLIGRSKETAHLLNTVHRWLAYVLAAVVAVHAAAAVRHHYVDRDDVLRRMLSFRGPQT
jgi:cytochrome b561